MSKSRIIMGLPEDGSPTTYRYRLCDEETPTIVEVLVRPQDQVGCTTEEIALVSHTAEGQLVRVLDISEAPEKRRILFIMPEESNEETTPNEHKLPWHKRLLSLIK